MSFLLYFSGYVCIVIGRCLAIRVVVMLCIPYSNLSVQFFFILHDSIDFSCIFARLSSFCQRIVLCITLNVNNKEKYL